MRQEGRKEEEGDTTTVASGHSPTNLHWKRGRERERAELITASIPGSVVVTGVAAAVGLFSAVALLDRKERERKGKSVARCIRIARGFRISTL